MPESAFLLVKLKFIFFFLICFGFIFLYKWPKQEAAKNCSLGYTIISSVQSVVNIFVACSNEQWNKWNLQGLKTN